MYAENTPQFVKNYPVALKELFRNSGDAQLYKAMGGFGTSIFDQYTGLKDRTRLLDRAQEKTLGQMEKLNVLFEQATRFAEFKAVLQREGRTYEGIRKAMYAASEITVNFGRSGTVGKWLNATFVPFLNPGIQGTVKAIRSFSGYNGKKAALRFVVKAALFGMVPSVLNRLFMDDDKDYENLPDRERWGNFIIPLGDRKYLRIPKGRILSVLGAGADAVISLIEGDAPDWVELGKFAAGQTAPSNPITSNIFAPMDAMRTNMTWFGGKIESDAMQGKYPQDRYDEKTDRLSIWLGKVLKFSPKKINYLLDSYTGVIGDYLLPLLTPYAEQNGFAKAFTVDSVLTNETPTQFYKAIQDLNGQVNHEGAEPYAAYALAYMNKQAKQVSEINDKIRDVQNSTVLTDKD
jgi:hypothetical protein